MVGTFPFGCPVQRVVQHDRSPKRVFVLGIYASAVHASWLAPDGSTLMASVAVASEPEVFWRGEGADEIVAGIELPPDAGTLLPAGEALNGSSGIALDELFLAPLGLDRSDAWLCDLVPYSCKNDRQARALKRTYDARAASLGLPAHDWPDVPAVLADETRREEIAAEIALASPDLLVTLGDQPLKWFTSHYGSKSRLGSYGESPYEYGRVHDCRIGTRTLMLLPLAHPRQVAHLGSHSAQLALLHERWIKHVADGILIDTSL